MLVDSLESRVIAVIAEHFALSDQEISIETQFLNDLGADAVDMAALFLELESVFDISLEIPDKIVFDEVADVVDLVAHSLPKK